MVPSRGVMEVAMLPALNRVFSRFSLDGGAAETALAAD
jgi:hypothetical protein